MQTASSRECPSCLMPTNADACPACLVPTLSKDPASDPLVGTVFAGKFRIEGRLGTGAMSTVYRAHQLAMDRPVALKILKSSAAGDDMGVRRFYRELRATARVEHPNTIRVYDFGHTDKGELYLAVELLHGRTLFEAMRDDGVFEPLRVVRVGLQVAKALTAAHRAGVVHRDLKPENLFLLDVFGERDFVKVLDFGIARVHDGSNQVDAARTTYGGVVGTPLYMSPEHVNGNLDGRSDLYSLGVVLYAMATGREPFSGKDPVQILLQHLTTEPPPLSVAGRTIPALLEALILRLLAKDPALRPQSAEQLVGELQVVGDVLLADEAARTSVTPAPAAPLHERVVRGGGVIRDGGGVVRDGGGVARDGDGAARDGGGVARDGGGAARARAVGAEAGGAAGMGGSAGASLGAAAPRGADSPRAAVARGADGPAAAAIRDGAGAAAIRAGASAAVARGGAGPGAAVPAAAGASKVRRPGDTAILPEAHPAATGIVDMPRIGGRAGSQRAPAERPAGGAPRRDPPAPDLLATVMMRTPGQALSPARSRRGLVIGAAAAVVLGVLAWSLVDRAGDGAAPSGAESAQTAEAESAPEAGAEPARTVEAEPAPPARTEPARAAESELAPPAGTARAAKAEPAPMAGTTSAPTAKAKSARMAGTEPARTAGATRPLASSGAVAHASPAAKTAEAAAADPTVATPATQHAPPKVPSHSLKTPETAAAAKPPTKARVSITSAPKGAAVTLDGRRLGATPTSVELPAGTKGTVRVRMRGYVDRAVSFVAGEDDAVHAVLTRATGGSPGAPGKPETKKPEGSEPATKPVTFEKWD